MGEIQLTTKQIEILENLLKSLHKKLSEEMEGLSRHIHEPVDKNLLDSASENEDKEITQIEDMIEEDQIHQVEEALQRIMDHKYGICEDCGKGIPFERLKIIPYVRYCVKCEGKHE
jgi:DnaK suppressor protein